MKIFLLLLFVISPAFGANGSIIEENLDVAGGFGVELSSKTANYTITRTDHSILVDASSGNITITLPASSGVTGIIYNIKKIDSSANTVTVDGNGTETIDDGTTAELTTQYESITIQSDGTTWFIL